jgi:hypothetical protein
MLHELLRAYAIRAREFSDAVAGLGRHKHVGPEFHLLLREIKERQLLCISTGEEVDQCIEQESPAGQFPVPGRTPGELDEELNGAKQEMVAARKRYKMADEEYRILTAQAHDVGVGHPDGAMAMQIATRNLNRAMEHYQTAVSKLTELWRRRFRP